MSRVVRTLFISIFSVAIGIPSVFARQAQDMGAPPAPQKLDKATKRKMHKTLKELGFEYRQWLTEDEAQLLQRLMHLPLCCFIQLLRCWRRTHVLRLSRENRWNTNGNRKNG